MSATLARRRFLSAAAVLACGTLAERASALDAAQDDGLTASRFAAQVGRAFTARSLSARDAHVYAMRLRAVEPIARGAPGAPTALERERSFMLVFDVAEPTARQDTYRITNAQTGEFAALLVPGRNPSVLTAVFNRAQ